MPCCVVLCCVANSALLWMCIVCQYHAAKHRMHIHSKALFATQHNTTRHAATTPKWYSEINVTFYSVTLARTIWLPDDGLRTETCRSVFNVLICKFYICAEDGIINE